MKTMTKDQFEKATELYNEITQLSFLIRHLDDLDEIFMGEKKHIFSIQIRVQAAQKNIDLYLHGEQHQHAHNPTHQLCTDLYNTIKKMYKEKELEFKKYVE